MAIDPEALEEFLWRDVPPTLPVRGADPAWLHQIIRDNLGVDYHPKMEPRAPQLEGLALAVHVERCLLFFGMRIGKSKIALDWATLLRQGRRWSGKGLVIAHAPIGINVWQEQARIHSDLKVVGIRTGPGSLEAFLDALGGDADLLVMPWPTLVQLFTVKRDIQRGARKGELKLYRNLEFLRDVAPLFGLVIIDEIHRCKNHQALWFQIAAELVAHCRYRLGLTGTPIGRDPFVVWAQAFLIDGGRALSGSFHFFEAAFGVKKKTYGRLAKVMEYQYTFDPKKLHILRAKLAHFTLDYKLEDIQEINVEHDTITLRMSLEQREAYQQVLDDAIALEEAGNDEVALTNNYMVRRQISSGFQYFIREDGSRGTYLFPNSPKLEWVAKLIDGLGGDVQVVVFYEFNLSGAAICKLLDKAKQPYGRLWSGTKDKGATIEAFKAGTSRWLIANTGSGSMAIDLPMADYLLFYESPTSPIVRSQAEARPLSRGAKVLQIDDLVCSPIEHRILGFIRDGKSALAGLLNSRSERGFF